MSDGRLFRNEGDDMRAQASSLHSNAHDANANVGALCQGVDTLSTTGIIGHESPIMQQKAMELKQANHQYTTFLGEKADHINLLVQTGEQTSQDGAGLIASYSV